MNTVLRGIVILTMTTGLGILGCSDGDKGVDPNPPAASCDKAALDSNKQLALKVSLDVFLKNAPADGILSDKFVAHFPGGQPDQDLTGFLGFGGAFRAAFPDCTFVFTHVIADGDLVALRYIGKGTHKAEIFGVPATNKVIQWEGMVVRRMSEGLVVEEWNAPDNAGLFAQLAMGAPMMSPNAKDHQGAGDCTPSVLDAAKETALGVSKDVVLAGGAPDALVSTNFTMHNPNGIPDQNLEGFLGFNAGFRAAFPDAAFTFTHTIGEGGLVALRYTAKGTHSAEFLGVPSTGKAIAWEGMVIRRMDTGKAAEEWNAPDISGIMAQLMAP